MNYLRFVRLRFLKNLFEFYCSYTQYETEENLDQSSLKTTEAKTFFIRNYGIDINLICQSQLSFLSLSNRHRGPGKEIGHTRDDLMRRTCLRFPKSNWYSYFDLKLNLIM